MFRGRDAVGRPANCPDVGIVQRILVGGGGACSVGAPYGRIKRRIFLVLIGIVLAGLASGVGRIANDYPDVQALLVGNAFVVLREDQLVHGVAGFGHLERVGEDDAVERLVLGSC